MATTDLLWGGTVGSVTFDPTSRRLSMVVEVVDSGVHSVQRLILDGVSDLRFDRPDDEWERTELTSIAVAEHPDGQRVQCEFWTDRNGMTAVCKQLRVEAPDVG